MRYKDLVIYGINELKKNNLDTQLSNYLISHYLHLNEKDKFNNIVINFFHKYKFMKAIKRLIKGEPIQYIIGSVNFYGYNYKVNSSVLIPRFETEELVHYTIDYIKKYFKSHINIIDVGTGSGVIGITLKKEIHNININMVLTDISKQALKIAQYNADKLVANVKIVEGDMLEPFLKEKEKYDIIISNPPYIKENENVMDIVKKNEPKQALYGGKDGLNYYHQILCKASKILNYKSMIVFEIGDTQSKNIVDIAKKYFPDSKYEIKKDMQERDRMLFIFNNIND